MADAGVAIERIVQQVQAAATHMLDISTASQEQSRKIGEVTSSIGQIDAVTQHNASMASHAVALTETLRSEAQLLAASVGELNATGAVGLREGGAAKSPAGEATESTALPLANRPQRSQPRRGTVAASVAVQLWRVLPRIGTALSSDRFDR